MKSPIEARAVYEVRGLVRFDVSVVVILRLRKLIFSQGTLS